jgi:hypothetical protein
MDPIASAARAAVEPFPEQSLAEVVAITVQHAMDYDMNISIFVRGEHWVTAAVPMLFSMLSERRDFVQRTFLTVLMD